jgi:uncharacterized protein with NAD-binding domain and iron-sulfur cluster
LNDSWQQEVRIETFHNFSLQQTKSEMNKSATLAYLLLSLAPTADAFTVSKGSIQSISRFDAPTITSKFTSTTQLQESKNDKEEQEESEEPKSVAAEWAKDLKQSYDQDTERKRKYLVVGGGWGGWGAAQALAESNIDCEITLLDALPDPTGATPYLSKSGKPVEAGTRGFWKDYPNINDLCAQLDIKEDDVFTPFTNSSFYSPDGLEATAPVFSEATLNLGKLGKDLNLPFELPFQNEPFPQLPSPFGQVLATFPLFERIPLSDRASMVGLLLATIDCLGADESVQMQYDRMTAHDLFLKFGLSERLVDDFIRPTLLVGLFKPPEELSALVVMELLYYYALAHQDSFDVRWIKNGSVADSLIKPLAEMLQKDHGLNVLGGCRVGEISLEKDYDDKLKASSVKYTKDGKEYEIGNVDGIILALGCKGMESVVGASPDLAKLPTFSKAASLKGIDVISTRIWFDKVVPTRTPANVFAKFEELRGAGGTFFMLDQLQGNTPELWGESSNTDEDEMDQAESRGSVVAADFYNAGALMSLSDDDLIKTLTEDLLPSAVPRFKGECDCNDTVMIDLSIYLWCFIIILYD